MAALVSVCAQPWGSDLPELLVCPYNCCAGGRRRRALLGWPVNGASVSPAAGTKRSEWNVVSLKMKVLTRSWESTELGAQSLWESPGGCESPGVLVSVRERGAWLGGGACQGRSQMVEGEPCNWVLTVLWLLGRGCRMLAQRWHGCTPHEEEGCGAPLSCLSF